MNQRIKIALIMGGAALVLFVALPLLAQALRGCLGIWPWMMGSGMMDGFGWAWFMPPLMIFFWGLVVWAIVLFIRGVSRSGRRESSLSHQSSALELLKMRYARGEITREEYENKKRDIA